jgi:hypothetical protein
LENLAVIWYTLLPFGIFRGHLENNSRFGMLYQKNLATLTCTEAKQVGNKIVHSENWHKGRILSCGKFPVQIVVIVVSDCARQVQFN